MTALIKRLFLLLDRDQKKKIYIVQLLIFLTSISEIISIVSIGPFMSAVGDIGVLSDGGILSKVYIWSGVSSPEKFVFFLGFFSILMLFLGSCVSILNSWITIFYGQKIGASISNNLYREYLYKTWQDHSLTSSSELTKKIAQESGRLTNGIVLPLMQMNSKIILIFFMSIAMLFYNPVVTMSGMLLFVLSYVVIYKLVKSRLQFAGEQLTEVNSERYKLMAEGFGGIRDVLLMGKQNFYIKKFCIENEKVVDSQTTFQTLSQIPKYIIELIAFGSIIILVLFLMSSHDGDLGKVLPVIAIFALTGFKLLPALQAVYSYLAKIKANCAAFESISSDLECKAYLDNKQEDSDVALVFEQGIKLDSISFRYSGKVEEALKNISMDIHAKKSIAIVGASGSGKSTVIDIIMGLISPDSGRVIVDDCVLDKKKLPSWQKNIGLVSQSIFLSDSSIMENIAFGLSLDEIDESKVEKAVELACLNDLVGSLPLGIHTKVGERGVLLSGGQRQRIGIARALYNDARLLVFDEATSALDGITEKQIMNAINNLSGERTLIIVAHRLSTIKKCDVIYFMDKGEILASGSYAELLKTSEHFKELDLFL